MFPNDLSNADVSAWRHSVYMMSWGDIVTFCDVRHFFNYGHGDACRFFVHVYEFGCDAWRHFASNEAEVTHAVSSPVLTEVTHHFAYEGWGDAWRHFANEGWGDVWHMTSFSLIGCFERALLVELEHVVNSFTILVTRRDIDLMSRYHILVINNSWP